MVRHIMIKEIRHHIFTNIMFVYTSVVLLLLIINGFVFSMNYNRCFANYIEIRNENVENIRDNSENLLDLVFEKQKLIKPPSNLSFISEGQQRNLPNGLDLNFFSESNPQYYKNQNLFFSTLHSMDWTNIFFFFISFLCICFSYNAFSGEKVRGTLKLSLSNQIPRWHLIVGKYFGIMFVIFSPIIIGLVSCQFNIVG